MTPPDGVNTKTRLPRRSPVTVSTNSSAVMTPRNSSCHSLMLLSHSTCLACPLRTMTDSSGFTSSSSSSESELSPSSAETSAPATLTSPSASAALLRSLRSLRAVLFAVARHAALTSPSAAMPLSAMRCMSYVRICSSSGNTSVSMGPCLSGALPCWSDPMGRTTVCSARYPLSLGVAM